MIKKCASIHMQAPERLKSRTVVYAWLKLYACLSQTYFTFKSKKHAYG